MIYVVRRHGGVPAIFLRWMNDNLKFFEEMKAEITIVEADEAGIRDGRLVMQGLAAGVEELNTAVTNTRVDVNGKETLAVHTCCDNRFKPLADEHHVAHCVAPGNPLGIRLVRMLLADGMNGNILVTEKVAQNLGHQLLGKLIDHTPAVRRRRQCWMLGQTICRN